MLPNLAGRSQGRLLVVGNFGSKTGRTHTQHINSAIALIANVGRARLGCRATIQLAKYSHQQRSGVERRPIVHQDDSLRASENQGSGNSPLTESLTPSEQLRDLEIGSRIRSLVLCWVTKPKRWSLKGGHTHVIRPAGCFQPS